MIKTFTNIFEERRYKLIAISIFLISLFGSLSLIYLPLVRSYIEISNASNIPFSDLFPELLITIRSYFSPFHLIITFLITLLFGINIAIIAYYIRDYRNKLTGITTSTLGVILGVFGIGCASCGSLMLVAILSFLGIGTSLSFLPLGGRELGTLGVVLLVVSTYLLIRKIHKPSTCEVK